MLETFSAIVFMRNVLYVAQLLHQVGHGHHQHHHHHQHCLNTVWYFYLTTDLSPWKPDGHHCRQHLRFWEFWPTAITQAATAATCARYGLCALQDTVHLILRRSLQSTYHYPFLQLRTQSLRNWLNCREVCGAVGIFPRSICLNVYLSETAMPFSLT